MFVLEELRLRQPQVLDMKCGLWQGEKN